MTQQELDALKALEAAATPGPWRGDTDRGEVKYAVLGADGALVLRVDHKNAESGFLGDNSENDEAFVLAAREAVPALIAEVERLQAAWGTEHDAYIRADEQARMARREVERLRAELAAARNLTMDVRRADNGDVVISVE